MRQMVIVVVLLVAAACGGDAEPSLVGVWTGTEVGAAVTEEWTFTFTETGATVSSDGTEIYAATYVARPGQDPKAMEIMIIDSSYPPFIDLTAQAIYEVDGTTLILASNEPGVAEVPTGFVANGGTRVWELVSQ